MAFWDESRVAHKLDSFCLGVSSAEDVLRLWPEMELCHELKAIRGIETFFSNIGTRRGEYLGTMVGRGGKYV